MRVTRARSAAGLTGLLRRWRPWARAAALTASERSAVTSMAGALAAKCRRSASMQRSRLRVEVIIDDHEVDAADLRRREGQRLPQPGRNQDAAAPAFEQGAHPVEHARLVVDAEHDRALEGGQRARNRRARLRERCCAGPARQPHREKGAAAGDGAEGDGVVEGAGDAIDDREAEAEPLLRIRRRREALELLEHQGLLLERNAAPGIMHLDRDLRARAPGAHENLAGGRVADRIRQEVLEDAMEEAPVAVDGEAGRHDAEIEALALG